jgi:hypothetical protein
MSYYLINLEKQYECEPNNIIIDNKMDIDDESSRYLIYYLEKTIYSSIMYVLSLIYGTTYFYQFDKLFLFTDFYYDPGQKNPQGVSYL